MTGCVFFTFFHSAAQCVFFCLVKNRFGYKHNKNMLIRWNKTKRRNDAEAFDFASLHIQHFQKKKDTFSINVCSVYAKLTHAAFTKRQISYYKEHRSQIPFEIKWKKEMAANNFTSYFSLFVS